MTPQRLAMLNARKKYSECARRLELKIKQYGLSTILSEQVVGVGIAADWLRRAAEMEDVAYLGKQLSRSNRRASFVELLRYDFSWFGLNAIFARPELLKLVGVPRNSGEFQRFLVLFNATALPDAPAQTADLHKLLAAQVSSRLPNTASATSVSALCAIHTKYLSHSNPVGATAKAIESAAVSGRVSALDLATLLYALRNWSVHGNALDGCFGSRSGFRRYVQILQEVLASVHVTTATKLAANI